MHHFCEYANANPQKNEKPSYEIGRQLERRTDEIEVSGEVQSMNQRMASSLSCLFASLSTSLSSSTSSLSTASKVLLPLELAIMSQVKP